MERQMESDFVHMPKTIRLKSILLSSEERLVNDPVAERETCLCEHFLHIMTLHQQIQLVLLQLLLNDTEISKDQQECKLFADNISEVYTEDPPSHSDKRSQSECLLHVDRPITLSWHCKCSVSPQHATK